MRRSRRLASLLIAAAALVFAVPASAQAALSFSSVSAAPASTQAGAHSDLSVHIGFGGAPDSVKDLVISLPPGEVGDPNATPFCSTAQLNADSCPANTLVGSASSSVGIPLPILGITLPNPLPVTGNVYNVAPHAGEPARFGIALHATPLPPPLSSIILPPIILQSGVQLRPSDFGLNTVVLNIPDHATLIQLGSPLISVPIAITGMDLGLKGVAPGTGKPFLRNPTSCTPHAVSFQADSHSAPSTVISATARPFTPTGCGGLDFSPSFSAKVGAPGSTGPARLPTNVTTSIDQDNGEGGLIKAQVQVPSNDLVPDTNLLGSSCDPASFQAGACPAGTVVGSAVAASPLLTEPLSGPVVLVNNGSILPDIGLDLNGQLHLQLKGSLTLSELVTFDGLPDIPISHFALTFGPQPGLLLANRNLCTPPAPMFHADFSGYNGASTSVDAAATVEGCGGLLGKCKKAKGKKRKHKADASISKKHKKKRGCKKKKRKKHRK